MCWWIHADSRRYYLDSIWICDLHCGDIGVLMLLTWNFLQAFFFVKLNNKLNRNNFQIAVVWLRIHLSARSIFVRLLTHWQLTDVLPQTNLTIVLNSKSFHYQLGRSSLRNDASILATFRDLIACKSLADYCCFIISATQDEACLSRNDNKTRQYIKAFSK